MKLILISWLLVSVCSASFSQSVWFGLRGGHGKFSMSEMKQVETRQLVTARDTLGIKPVQVTSFPDNFSWIAFTDFTMRKITYSMEIGTFKTGSRISYSDYSGRLLEDKVMTSVVGGLKVYRRFWDRVVSVEGSLALNLYLTNTQISNVVEFYRSNEVYDFRNTYHTRSIVLQPNIRVSYLVLEMFKLIGTYGYAIDLAGGKLSIARIGVSKLEWQGSRIDFGVGFLLSKSKDER